MSTVEVIREAIRGHHRLAFSYRGRPRVVNPQRLGVSRSGAWQLRAIQVGGASASGRYGGDAPKLFDVAQMRAVSLLPAHFPVPRGYRPGDGHFAHIDTELTS